MLTAAVLTTLSSAAVAVAASPPSNPVLDRLLAQLAAAPDEQTALGLELRIHEQWRAQGSPAAKLLLESGVIALQQQHPEAATENIDAALELEPDYAEAYSDRAAAHLATGDYAAALRDAGEALAREPRHFDALRILSQVAEARHDWKGALEAWRRALALSPQTHEGRQRLNLLRRNAEGEAT